MTGGRGASPRPRDSGPADTAGRRAWRGARCEDWAARPARHRRGEADSAYSRLRLLRPGCWPLTPLGRGLAFKQARSRPPSEFPGSRRPGPAQDTSFPRRVLVRGTARRPGRGYLGVCIPGMVSVAEKRVRVTFDEVSSFRLRNLVVGSRLFAIPEALFRLFGYWE